jgi:hypothetical protein
MALQPAVGGAERGGGARDAGARGVDVRVGPDRILIPDLVVLEEPDMRALVADAAAVRLAVEIVSPGNAFMDRVVKPSLYARAAIPSYLRIELEDDAPVGHLHELDRGAYREVASGPTITASSGAAAPGPPRG